jgi:hypothetical protein
MLDYQKIIKKAEQFRISPHLLVKREINYRKAKLREADCRFCLHLIYVGYKIGSQRMQCDIIGSSINYHSDVDHLHICNEYKKLECGEIHDFKKHIFMEEK